MQAKNLSTEGEVVSKMAIVDTFTKLIFRDEHFSAQERAMLDALRAVDMYIRADDQSEMGHYIRALGVEEMVQLVSAVSEYLARDLAVVQPGKAFTQGKNASLYRT